MRIGIDLYSFIPDKNFGVGPSVYAYNLVKHLVAANSQHFFVIFTNNANQEFFSPGKNCKIVSSKFPPSKGILRVVHEQLMLPFYFYREKLDLIHFTGNVISFFLGKKAVLTVYDLMWKYYLKSDWVPLYKRIYYSSLCPLSFRGARGLISISRFIKDELTANLVNSKKVFVTHLAQGVPPQELTEHEILGFQKKFPKKFIFTATTTWPHKNLITLLKAFVLLRKTPGFDHHLVVVGQNRLPNQEINRFIREERLDLSCLSMFGFVSDRALQYLYSNARVFVFPSLYEGFGLPLLEAMKAGVPIVASRAASLPEVGGDACLYADPKSAEDFAEKVNQLLTDQDLRNKMIAQGKAREASFSWNTLALETIAIYEKIVS